MDPEIWLEMFFCKVNDSGMVTKELSQTFSRVLNLIELLVLFRWAFSSCQERKGNWSLMKIFLVCLLACVITTAIGVLVLSLVYTTTTHIVKEVSVTDDGATSMKPEEKSVDVKFQFLNHLTKSKVNCSTIF